MTDHQGTIFDPSPLVMTPDGIPHSPGRSATRETSRAARDHIEREGVGEAQRDVAADLVRRHPGETSAELARHIGATEGARHMLGRRLPELADEVPPRVRRGDKRACAASPRGLKAVTWWPVEGSR